MALGFAARKKIGKTAFFYSQILFYGVQ